MSTGQSPVSRLYVLLAVAMLVLLEVFSLTGICMGPSALVLKAVEPSSEGFAAASSFLTLLAVIYLAAQESWLYRGFVCASGLLFVGVAHREGVSLWPTGVQWFFDGVAIAALLQLLHAARLQTGAARQRAWEILAGSGIAISYCLIPLSALSLISALHPATHELHLLALDSAFGFQPSTQIAGFVQAQPWAYQVITAAYGLLTPALVALYGFQLASRKPQPVFILEFMIASGIFACIAYNLYPITGPRYLFGDSFPNAVPPLSDLPFAMVIVEPAPRNGMPSFHLIWALTMWLLSRHLSRVHQVAYGTLLVLTAVATIATGEHYLIDLVVALPCVAALIAICSGRLPWGGVKIKALAWGGATYVAWLLLFWFAIPAMIAQPWILWLAVAASSLIACYWLASLDRANFALQTGAAVAAPLRAYVTNAGDMRVPSLFVVSGAAALIYQVLFSKQLAYVFGSMSTATNTVLATYMAGMALGAWLGGLLAPKIRKPLLAFAVCEFGIAIYCALSPPLLFAVQRLYVSWAYGLSPDASVLLTSRVLLGASVLLLPTVLMGMTLPLLARHFDQRNQAIGVSAGRLYAANTLGAAAGALFAGYFVIPLLGLHRTTYFAVVCNLIVVLLALALHKRFSSAGAAEASSKNLPAPEGGTKLHAYAGLFVLAVGGFVTLGLEIGFIHLLSVAAGNSTYAFSLMLFSFLLGLGGGAEAGRRLVLRYEPVLLLAWLEMALAGAICFGLFKINALPQSFADYELFPVAYGFAAREVIRGIACCIAMVPAAAVIGAIFPVAIEAVTRGYPRKALPMLGTASALNTFGNIAGVLVAGFVLIPALGGYDLVRALAVAAFLLGLALLFAIKASRSYWTAIPVGTAAAMLWFLPATLNYDALTSGANVYFRSQPWGQVVDRAESLDGGLTTVNVSQTADGKPRLTLLTNGKFQGNDVVDGEMIAQMGFAIAPMLHTTSRNSALVIGYGTGNTSRVLHDAGFGQLHIVDLSADIFRLANKHLSKINARVTDQQNVQAFVTDGRNFLLLAESRYDLISMEVSSIWFAGAATLYSRDFYALAKKRLNPGGVLQQWMQLHHASPGDVFYILGSIRAEFDYVWLYYIGGQGIIVASNDPQARPEPAHMQKLDETPSLAPTIQHYGGTTAHVEQKLLLRPEEIDRFLESRGRPRDFFVSTDDNAVLEYSTPKGNALDGVASQDANYRMLAAFSGKRQAH